MKLTITIQSGTLTGRSWDLTEGFLTVGRGGNCNLIFDPTGENMVSTKHAYFEAKPDGFYLVDTKSTNGTFVNGNRIQVVKLNPGDTVQFGKNGPQGIVSIEMQQTFQPTPPPTTQDVFQPTPPMQQETVQMVTQNQQPTWSEQFQNQNQDIPYVQPLQNEQYSEPFPQQTQQPQNFGNPIINIGLSNPAFKVEEPSDNTGKIIGAIVAVVIFAVMGLLSALFIVSAVGIIPAIIATFIAFIPPIIYILPLIFLDRYDPEPPWLIASAFAWGGAVSIFFSGVLNTLFGNIAAALSGSPAIGMIFSIVISAPVVEEFFKGIGVVLIMLLFRKEFDDILDGIVYGGVVGLGFATVENILYYGGGVSSGGLLFLLLVRGVMSPFIHSTFTAMTGIGCGIARESHNTMVRIFAPIGGYIAAVALHMGWNGGIGVISGILMGNLGFFISYTVLGVPFFLLFIGFCVYIMRRQNKILREMLAIDTARGLITQEQMDTATSAFKSTGWLFGGITSGKFMARWKFLRAVGKLGLTYWHIQRANAAQGQTGSFQQNPILRGEVEKWRTQV